MNPLSVSVSPISSGSQSRSGAPPDLFREISTGSDHRAPFQTNGPEAVDLARVEAAQWNPSRNLSAELISSVSPLRQRAASSPGTSRDTSLISPPPPAKTKKRPAPVEFSAYTGFSNQSPNKRARDRNRTYHALRDNSAPPPLFFSQSQRARPPLPPRPSSFGTDPGSLSGNEMEDNGGIRTVKLARGSIVMGNSPPRALSTPVAYFSPERPCLSRVGTSDPRESVAKPTDLLHQIGIAELLELDDRPIFIVDLSNQANFQPGVLRIVYFNTSLRAYGNLLDKISGALAEESSGLTAPINFHEFKEWVLSFVKNNEPMDVLLPSFMWAGFTWICTTLRRRFRLITGTEPTGPASMSSHPPSAGTPSLTSMGHPRAAGISNGPSARESPHDYFGNAQQFITDAQRFGPAGDVLSMVKSPHPHVEGSKDKAQLGATGPSLVAEGCDLGAVTPAEADHFHGSDAQEPGFFDWTRLPVTPALPRHIQFARSVDWSSTSLGPIKTWPAALRGMCNLIMASPHPAAMYWGDDYVVIYNEAYILLAGQKHPMLMGQSYAVAWPEVWDTLGGVFEMAKQSGQATMKDDDLIFMKRNGYLEETYFSWSIIPLVGDDGSVAGLYNPAFEKTRRKIAERRMLTLREVGEQTAVAREVKGFWGQVLKGLESNDYDTPFVLLYSVSDDIETDGSSVHSNSLLNSKQCVLEGTLPPLPENHPAAPVQIDLKTGVEGFAPMFREAMRMDRPVLLETSNGTLDGELLENMEWRGFGDIPRAAIVCPIHLTTGDSILGFLVMGINPRRPYDDDYNLFIQLLSRQLATSMASVVLFEEEIRKGQKAAEPAALDRIELSEQLAARTQQVEESETKFTRMAEFAPVGMFIADSEGRTIFTNDYFHKISNHPKEQGDRSESTNNWMDSVKDEDKEMVTHMWTNLVENRVSMSAEFRFKGLWEGRNGVRGDTWVLASAYPERYADGRLKSVFGSITNISQQKWAEDFQKKRMEEAVELKRQQEAFIDITSHEMRNPLSAIIHCADEISASLTSLKSDAANVQIPIELIDSNIDAAQTIALCANHQTRIVSDVLTMSKLESALLFVTPVDARPRQVAQQALKMFDGELQTAGIRMEFTVDESMEKLQVDWVRLDPSRLLQVLINLTTNAIKFTSSQAERVITLTLSASLSRTSSMIKDVSYVPTRTTRKVVNEGPDWGTGEIIYLYFRMQDTGKGLSDEEKKLLFLRFSQANPKTHVQYGGSGLGLFISRELVELQGGEIGVSSESGKGSTFEFYVKARKSNGPRDQNDFADGYVITPSRMRQTQVEDSLDVSSLEATASTAPNSSSSSQQSSRMLLKVLVVEDNVVNQKVLGKQLRNLGCAVHIANHGGECIDQLRESRWWHGRQSDGLDLGVILMDLEMPVMDGLTCATKIRELQSEGKIVGHVPIIAVTANARDEQIMTALAAGMDDVVSKPFRIPELIPKIEQLVIKYKMPGA